MATQAREMSKRADRVPYQYWNEPKKKKAQKTLKDFRKTNCCNTPFLEDSDFCLRCGEYAGEIK